MKIQEETPESYFRAPTKAENTRDPMKLQTWRAWLAGDDHHDQIGPYKAFRDFSGTYNECLEKAFAWEAKMKCKITRMLEVGSDGYCILRPWQT